MGNSLQGVSKRSFDARRIVRGLSWTLRPTAACYFATSMCGGKVWTDHRGREIEQDPAIYVARVRPSEIFVMCPPYHPAECEVIVRPERCRRLPLTFQEIKAAGDSYRRALKGGSNASEQVSDVD